MTRLQGEGLLAIENELREGLVRQRSGDLVGARAVFESLVVNAPEVAQARLALASVCLEMSDAPAAAAVLREFLAKRADDATLWHALALAEEAAGDVEAALSHYGRALQLSVDFPEALLNRTALYLRLGAAAAALRDAERLVALRPFFFAAQFNLGEAHAAAWGMDAACRAYARALRLRPESARTMLHYGFALACCGRYAEAQVLLDRARALDPALLADYRLGVFGVFGVGEARLEARALHLLADYERIERADWSARDDFLARFSAQAALVDEPALAFRALAMGLPGEAQLTLNRSIATAILCEAGGERVAVCLATPREATRRIRLGYVSPDFRQHPTSLLLGEMLAWHDPGCFEVFAYPLTADDGSEARRQVLAGADQVVDLSGLNDAEAAERIAADGIDLLLDLGGYNDLSRPGILARRPAPVQLSWLAFMATTGAPWIDYLLADRVAVPYALRAHFSEACLRLPGTFFPCAYAEAHIPTLVRREDYGLPPGKRVLAALHAPYKIDPQSFAVWLELLRDAEDCVLALLAGRSDARLNAVAEAAGIDVARLYFLPRLPHTEHLARLSCCDLVLDTPQCNGGTGTADALVAGTPVLTLAGQTLAQRMAASLLHAAGQDDMVASSLAAYRTLGLALLADPKGLHAQRIRLAAARGTAPFFAPRQWFAGFEAGLEAVWRRHCAGLPPADLDVAA